jgi:hypothetical protein
VGEVSQGDVVMVVGQSEDGEWLLVEPAEGEPAWLALSEVALQQGNLALVDALPSPPTPTPAPTTVAVVLPPPAPAPSANNLLTNPGFEDGVTGWQSLVFGYGFLSTSDYPQFIHSGNRVGFVPRTGSMHQIIYGLTPGTTYRFGVWGRVWSSPSEDRTSSFEPGEMTILVCVNPESSTDRWSPKNICSGPSRPLDTWHYFSVDGVATATQMSVLLITLVQSGPKHNETFWDDAYFGVAPVAATPVPPTPGPPVRPATVPFDAVAMRDNMVQLQATLEQMGGLLDRIYNGDSATCTDYMNYYRQAVQAPTYHSLPPEWQGVYNEYSWAADHIMGTGDPIYQLCVNRRGGLTLFNYELARSGVFDALARLIPAVAQANSLLGQ